MPEVLRLQKPSAALRDSYCSLISEIDAAAEMRIPFPLTFPFEDFDALLVKLEDATRGIGLADGFVPHSTFWLVRGDNEIVGVSNLRHSLNDSLRQHGGNVGYGIRPSARRNGFGREILRLTLERARSLGLSRVLVTCGMQNRASARIIIANGGVLESEPYISERAEVVQRYWIDLRA
jgi:predicted acetyltransferase